MWLGNCLLVRLHHRETLGAWDIVLTTTQEPPFWLCLLLSFLSALPPAAYLLNPAVPNPVPTDPPQAWWE